MNIRWGDGELKICQRNTFIDFKYVSIQNRRSKSAPPSCNLIHKSKNNFDNEDKFNSISNERISIEDAIPTENDLIATATDTSILNDPIATDEIPKKKRKNKKKCNNTKINQNDIIQNQDDIIKLIDEQIENLNMELITKILNGTICDKNIREAMITHLQMDPMNSDNFYWSKTLYQQYLYLIINIIYNFVSKIESIKIVNVEFCTLVSNLTNGMEKKIHSKLLKRLINENGISHYLHIINIMKSILNILKNNPNSKTKINVFRYTYNTLKYNDKVYTTTIDINIGFLHLLNLELVKEIIQKFINGTLQVSDKITLFKFQI